ncbi:hypothetical protein J3A84_10585, partial [Proteiniclasticum sp. SCR006]
MKLYMKQKVFSWRDRFYIKKEEITAMDKVKGNLARNTYLLYFGGAALLGLMTLFLAGLLI